MSRPSPRKLAEWRRRAARKRAIVPQYFEVFVDHAVIKCGNCGQQFSRNLVPNLDEPTFVCPLAKCKARNWIPLKFDKR